MNYFARNSLNWEVGWCKKKCFNDKNQSNLRLLCIFLTGITEDIIIKNLRIVVKLERILYKGKIHNTAIWDSEQWSSGRANSVIISKCSKPSSRLMNKLWFSRCEIYKFINVIFFKSMETIAKKTCFKIQGPILTCW